MKVIFLDVDGVLNRMEAGRWASIATIPQPTQSYPFVTEANIVDFFNREMSKRDDIKVVVSSTWRLTSTDAQDFANQTGIDVECIHEDWKTDRLGDRGLEIKHWLGKHPEVTHHVILDDTDYDFSGLNSVLTNDVEGLTIRKWKEALEYLE